ncbi:anhydro-N-acetylmuramic acid kinase [Motilimonas sp. 1_MG-2023]|uniref:anhydro-N-acetylmuramic acid kinase n=1 Tax=Motilimonas sp. 1_MG-2023 TaxID=3062672 RepID=UPI0026E1D82F|nr:anhydro-N-acetylmuramic acid kinase [Motilimonas sp. 1_MG-2023]MDO6524448.1 anhydro-N-acetylmuramic acid kinase [Motilimonas sp. 1_MG-2023]
MPSSITSQQYYIGLMSGTSLDGLDICIVDFSDQKVNSLYGKTFPIPTWMKEDILGICQGQSLTLAQLGQLDHKIGLFHGNCVNQALQEAGLSSNDIKAIGSHGQTVYHQPDSEHPFTMQIGDANLIAAITDVVTVADFRRMDMAYGGQGAPLVPAFHQALFSHPKQGRIVLNIGGIANLTVLLPNEPTLGYDTGPGNMLLNAWISTQLKQEYDSGGDWAASGNIIPELLDTFLAEPYFNIEPPKSTGRELFNLAWLKLQLKPEYRSEDIQQTLLMLTAHSVAEQVKRFEKAKELLICGGGVHNTALINTLKTLLPEHVVHSTQAVNIDPDFVEAIAFAWLAKQRIEGKPGNLPIVTGAQKKVCLGAVYQP